MRGVAGIAVRIACYCTWKGISNDDRKKESDVHQATEADSEMTFSDVMNWAQRFGNRVGENISEATSKTATAIKNAASDNKQQSQSEDSP